MIKILLFLMKGAKSSSGSVVETVEYQTYSRLRHAQTIINNNGGSTNNTDNPDIREAIDSRNLEVRQRRLEYFGSSFQQPGAIQNVPSTATINNLPPHIVEKNKNIIRSRGEKKNSSFVDEGDSSTVTEPPFNSRQTDSGLYQALDSNFFIADSNTGSSSFNRSNGPAVIEVPSTSIETREQAESFANTLLSSHLDLPNRTYLNNSFGERAHTIHRTIGEIMRERNSIRIQNIENYRSRVYNLLGGDLYDHLLHSFLLLSQPTLTYVATVITEMGSGMTEHFIYFALIFSFFRGLFLTVLNVRHLARHTVGAFIEIFTRALRHAQMDVSRPRIPNMTFNLGNIVPSITQLRDAAVRDLDAIIINYSTNNYSFWIALASAGTFIVGLGLRNPEVVTQIIGLVSDTFSGFFSPATVRRFLEIFYRTRM